VVFNKKADANRRPPFYYSNPQTFSNSSAEFDGSVEKPAPTVVRFANIFTVNKAAKKFQ